MTEKKYKEEIFKAQAGILKLENQLDVVNKRCGEVMAKNMPTISESGHGQCVDYGSAVEAHLELV